MKEYLSQKGVLFEDKDVTVNQAAAQEMMNLTGQRGVPVTTIDGQVIVGFNRPQLDQALSRNAQRPSFGAAIADAARIKNDPGIKGAYVGRLRPGTVAEHAGLTVGDIIIEINGRTVNTAADMENIISGIKSGETISVVFKRGNQIFTKERTF